MPSVLMLVAADLAAGVVCSFAKERQPSDFQPET